MFDYRQEMYWVESLCTASIEKPSSAMPTLTLVNNNPDGQTVLFFAPVSPANCLIGYPRQTNWDLSPRAINSNGQFVEFLHRNLRQRIPRLSRIFLPLV